MKTKIYVLIDPRNDKIRYLGKTVHSLKQRLDAHLKETKSSRKNNWVKSLQKENLNPVIKLIDEVKTMEWEFWESFWISILKILNFDLTNLTNGGEGTNGLIHTKKHIEKRVNKLKKKVKIYNLNGELLEICESIKQVSKKYKICKSHISECMNGVHGVKIINKKYIFRKIEDNFYSIKFKSDVKKQILQCSKEGMVIKKWNSIIEAANAFGVKAPNISRCLRGHRKYFRGFVWKYYIKI